MAAGCADAKRAELAGEAIPIIAALYEVEATLISPRRSMTSTTCRPDRRSATSTEQFESRGSAA